jgi:lipopolysaccharide/colanic/teichoic acid biosynthesis glycosyltransferase
MSLWPVLLDSQPGFARGKGRSASLLLAPMGTTSLLEHLVGLLAPTTANPPVVLSYPDASGDYQSSIHATCPAARVVSEPANLLDVFQRFELSDAFLVIDPRSIPIGDFQLSSLTRAYAAEPRVALHLVTFDTAIGGTKEKVSFDPSGQVRGIERHYGHATWPFIAGITASIIPGACGMLTEGLASRSLGDLRLLLAGRGVPSRDVPVEGGALNLAEERGMLAANEMATLRVARQRDGGVTTPIMIGTGQSVHASARFVGPVVVHSDVHIEAGATVLGPAVIGAGARIAARAVVAHATVGPDSIVPAGQIVRDRVWFGTAAPDGGRVADAPTLSYGERLARLAIDPATHEESQSPELPAAATFDRSAKRVLDVAAALISLTILAPFLGLMALAVWLESKGPIFFGDKREGEGGQVFRCWKFRTMFVGADRAQRQLNALDDTDGPHFKVDRDPRVTRVGRVLRALNVDELPQLFNVLMGEMSLVGPRPSPFRENQVCVPWRAARLSVPPGITGFWQVCRHERAAGDFHQWIEYDLLYVQYFSLWLDLKILAATVLTLGGKARHVPASLLLPGRVPARTGVPSGTEPRVGELAA